MEASTASRTAPHAARAGVSLRSPRLLRVASDDKLVAMVRGGNEAAFEAIYDRHHRPLLSFCRHMLSDRGESEDAVQHTFISAYNDLTASDKPVQLRAWLYTIARNRCLTMLRSRRERPTGEEIEVATEGLADEVQRRDDLQKLLVDMRDLPEDQRGALVLAELGALSHDEVAQVLDVPRAKVKALVFQARESLIASRAARDVSCGAIREELATAKGGALRRAPLRRHLRACDGCREFSGQVKHQRAAMALVLPVLPTLALKHASMPAGIAAKLSAAGIAGGGAAAAGGTGLALFAGNGTAAKVLAVLGIAGAGAGTVAAVDNAGDLGIGGVAAAVHAPAHHGPGGADRSAAPASPGSVLLSSPPAGAASGSRGATLPPARRQVTATHHRAPAAHRPNGTHGPHHRGPATHRPHGLRHPSAPVTAPAPAPAPAVVPAPPASGAGHHGHAYGHHKSHPFRGRSPYAPGHVRPHPHGRSYFAPGHVRKRSSSGSRPWFPGNSAFGHSRGHHRRAGR